MSIAVIARFKAAYASFAKLLLVSSRGTSRAGRSSFSTGRSWASGMAHGIWYTRAPQPAFTTPDGGHRRLLDISRARRRLSSVELIDADRARGGWLMNRPIFLVTLLASMLVLAISTPAPAEVDPASLAEQDLAAESRGDVAAALALYGDDAIVQYGGLCWTPCVGKAAVQKELERRVAAKNQWKVTGKYVSGNVAVVKTELQ